MGNTILLIDDSKMIQATFREALEEAGFMVISAGDGQKGLEIAKAEKPDLIILDVNMPVMNGWQFLRTLSITPEIEDIPVLLATTREKIMDIEKGFALGIKDYVVKNEDLSQLVNKVEKVMAESRTEKGWVKKIFS
ncbi:MAG: response regulator [Deltaproteobacteria bacterium]|nr:response regulator [Deltaproteobacteria bacterium]